MITDADIEKGAQAASAYSSIPASDLTDLVKLILRAVGFRSRQSATVRRRLRRKYKAKKEAEALSLDWSLISTIGREPNEILQDIPFKDPTS